MDFELEQPRTIGDLLSDALELYGRGFWLFIALALLSVVPFEVALALWNPGLLDPSARLPGWEAVAVYQVVGLTIEVPLVTASTTLAVARLGAGRAPTVGEILKETARVLPAVIGAIVATTLACLGGLVLLIAPGIWLGVLLTFSGQAAAVEATGAVGGLRRSIDLVRGRFWSTLGILLMITVVLIVFIALATLLVTAIPDTTLYIAGSILVEVAFFSVSAVIWALLFFSWRATRPPADERAVPAEA